MKRRFKTMTKRWKTSGSMAVTLAVVLALLFTACAPAEPVVGEKAIKIGLSLVMTGPIASTGVPLAEGFLDYLYYVNDDLGGIEYHSPEGKTEKVKLDITWEDNAYSVPKGIMIYKRQKARGVMLRILSSSSEAEALAEMMSRDHMPTLAMNATPVALAPKPRYYTAGYAAYADQIGGMINWAVEDWKGARPPRIGIIAIDAPTTRVARQPITPETVAQLGAEFAGWEWVPLMPTDTTIELTRMMTNEPDYVLALHIIAGSLVIFKDAVRLGIKDQVKWVQQQVGTDELMVRMLGDIGEGIYMQSVNAWPAEDVPGVKLAHSIIQRYRGHDATVLNVNGMYISMAALEGLRIALEKVGYDGLTRETINDALHNMKDFDTGGLVPLMTVYPSYPVLNQYIKIAVIEGGKFLPLGDFVECPAIAPRPE